MAVAMVMAKAAVGGTGIRKVLMERSSEVI
jgi:hypothetical protein